MHEEEEVRPAHSESDPHETFRQFFEENKPNNTEKEFFQKHFPEKMEEEFDPYKVLELKPEATLEQVKEAYRRLALATHPKNNPSPEAEKKFAEVGKAYDMIVREHQSKQEESGFKSFFDDFHKEVKSLWDTETKKAKLDKEEKEKKKVEG